jgi:hypothetical protein
LQLNEKIKSCLPRDYHNKYRRICVEVYRRMELDNIHHPSREQQSNRLFQKAILGIVGGFSPNAFLYPSKRSNLFVSLYFISLNSSSVNGIFLCGKSPVKERFLIDYN